MSMSRPLTCIPCRARKVKCDGAVPHCNRCVRTNRSPSCTYDLLLPTKRKVSALQKGEACIPCRTKKKRCDATRPICQRCTVARYQDQCVYDAAPPDTPAELSPSQSRRLLARQPSLSGSTSHAHPSPTPNSGQDSPYVGQQSSHALTTPLQPDYPMDKGEGGSQVSSLRDIKPAAPTSFANVQPLQKRSNIFHPRVTQSHYRSQQTRRDQNHPSSSSNDGSSVVIRSTALVPSSPLLKSTVCNSRASETYQIQADPTSPYYAYQNIRLTPNPIVRIIMDSVTNPRMFSLQTISPDTLSLLFRFQFVSHLTQFAIFLPVAKLQAIILGDISGTFVHPCIVHLANLLGCHLYQDNILEYKLNHLELLHLNTLCHALDEMDRGPEQQPQPRFHIPGQTRQPVREEATSRMPGEAEDPFTYAQIRLLMAMFALLWRCTGVASRLLRSVSYIVERNGLRFATEDQLARAKHGLDVSRVTPVPEFSEPDYERVVFLSTCLGADAGLQLFGLQRRAELSWLDLERQFFDELPVVYPTLAQMPLVWRDRGLLLLYHASGLQKQHTTGTDVVQSCKDLITSHFIMIQNLPTIIDLHKDDHESHLVLRCASIVAHAAMAVLLRTISQALAAGRGDLTAFAEDPTLSMVYRRRCRKELKEAINLTRWIADADYPFIDVTMAVCWFQMLTITTELDNEDVALGISPERESPPPSIPPSAKSPTIRSAEPMTRADQIRLQQAQYRREHQQPPSSSTSASGSFSRSSRSSSGSPPHQATISEIHDDSQLDPEPTMPTTPTMPSIDEVAEEMSDLQLLDKSMKQCQASFWRPVPDELTREMHRILEGLRVVMENSEDWYANEEGVGAV